MAPKPGQVIVRDRGMIKRRLNLRALRGWQTTIGIHGTEDERGEGVVDNVQLGVWHEFGTDDVPERSFLRSAWDKNVRTDDRLAQIQAGLVIDGVRTPKQAVTTVGERALADVVNGINRGIPPPNADSTIEAKGSSKPLINTGQLKGSITQDPRKA